MTAPDSYRPAPAAAGSRLPWHEMPERVRAALDAWLGSPVVSAQSQPSGFSPGAAARLQTADGRRYFAKAVGPELNPISPGMHRQEARVLAAIPHHLPVAKLLWTYDEGDEGWILLLFDDVEGTHPVEPWHPDELARALDALTCLANALTPVPPGLAHLERIGDSGLLQGRWWARLAVDPPSGLDAWSRRHIDRLAELEIDAPAAVAGDTVVHLDFRADNLLLTPDEVIVVDWAHASIGAPWVDLLAFLPSVAMQGGPEPESLFIRHPLGRDADPGAVNAALADIAGYFTYGALQPEPPELPGLRAFQAGQAVEARRWLNTRLISGRS